LSAETARLIEEATSLELFKPHGAFEVHCANCHTRLNSVGDCPTCGLIGRPAADLARRAEVDEEGVARLLREAIAKRKGYRPVGGKAKA
jgi:LSD1 subclass zinc finger protein